MKPEFQEATNELVEHLRKTFQVKKIKGRALTAPMLLNLALEYVDAINRKEKPVIESAFERVLQIESFSTTD